MNCISERGLETVEAVSCQGRRMETMDLVLISKSSLDIGTLVSWQRLEALRTN